MRKTFPSKPGVSLKDHNLQSRLQILLIGSKETKDVLLEMGFNVLNIKGVNEGINIISNANPSSTDILLVLLDLDWVFKDKEDLSFIEKLDAYNIPLILLLATDDGDFHNSLLQRGAKDCIIKPLCPHHYELLAQKAKAFQQSRFPIESISRQSSSVSVKVETFDHHQTQGHSIVGTPSFMAPELIRKEGAKLKYGKSVDW
jgi:DNA-binding response OmpR family regulator